jgi:hypothetical protein
MTEDEVERELEENEIEVIERFSEFDDEGR